MLMFECFEKQVECLIRITGFIEQGYKLAADDGSRRIILRTGKGLLVANAETNHARVAQIHAVDVVEISQLGITETALGTRDTRRTDHINETIGMLIDETDALLAGFRGNHHDDTDVILVGYGFHHLQIIIKRKVWDDGAAHSALYATLEKASMP